MGVRQMREITRTKSEVRELDGLRDRRHLVEGEDVETLDEISLFWYKPK